MFKKILIANRGEIACRIMRTAKRLGIETVSVYSDIDKYSKHVQMSDYSYHIGGNKSSESYLSMEKIIDVALKSGAQAIHPGYGFLSENVEFVKKCNDAKVKFIGPPEKAIYAMGSKIESKLIMTKSNVPIVPGYNGDNQDKDFLLEQADKIQYPVMIKADLGGGGKGMRIVRNQQEFYEMLSSAQSEAQKSFKSSKVLIEKYIENSKHIEVQVFGDEYGNYVHFFERDCTIQRRHQKVIEEAPSFLNMETRLSLCNTAIQAAKAVGYANAGTVEFIYDIDTNKFYFMEMNTRLQVEHPISEMITKQDFVELQLRIASGQKLNLKQEDIKIHGHAIECRVYSEDPNKGFLPGSGTIQYLKEPNNQESLNNRDENVRIETGIRQKDQVSIFYDPMISKLVTFAENRDLAIQKTIDCINNYKIYGLPTNLEFCSKILNHPVYKKWDFDTNFISKHSKDLLHSQDTVLNYTEEDILASALVKVVLEERALNNSNKNKYLSPWNSLKNFRLNYNHNKVFKIKTQSKSHDKNNSHNNTDVMIQYLSNGNFNILINDKLVFSDVSYIMNNSNSVRISVKNSFTKNFEFYMDHNNVVLLKNNGENTVVNFVQDDFGIVEDHNIGQDVYVKSPMSSTLSKLFVKEGQAVKKGESLLAIEAMKMEHVIKATKDLVIKKINFKIEQFVEEGSILIEFAKEEK